MKDVRRYRKLFGGAMRQSGVIAAGALYALENNRDRLVDDHAHAQGLASAIERFDGLTLEPDVVDTNIVIFRVDLPHCSASDFCAEAKRRGVWMLPFSRIHVRAVTHLHITDADVDSANRIIAETFESLANHAGLSRNG